MSKILKKVPLGNNTSKINSILQSSFTKKVGKSLVSVGEQQFIQLSQNEVNFINTDPNQIYQISFTVRNVSQKSWKLKMRKPKSQLFTVIFDKDGPLAPGLQKKITVTFNSEINEEIKDSMLLYCQDQFQVQVPVSVYPIIYNLSYQPFVNFGDIKVGAQKQHQVKITNQGETSVEIRLEPQVTGVKLSIIPSILNIQPKSSQTVTLHVTSNQVSEFQGTIEIFPQVLGEASIQIVGKFCQFTRYIANSQGQQLQQLQIKPMFGGQKCSSSFHLVNNTPKPCQFRIIRKRGFDMNDDVSSFITPQQFGRDNQQKTITFSTMEGQLEPNSKKQIACDIIAKIQESDQQLFCNYIAGRTKQMPYQSKQWSYLISTTFKDEETAKNLIIKGQSFIPKLQLSSIFFKFSQCPIRGKQEKTLKIENFSDRNVFITVEKSQNFSCLPQKFEIPADGSKQVIIKFCPKVVGELNQICHLKTAMFSFPIKMLGKGTFVKDGHKINSHRQKTIGIDLSRGVQMSLAEMDKTFLQEQISVINDKSMMYVQENSKITTTNFDCTVLSHKPKPENTSIPKKIAVKNKNGKQVILDIHNFNPDQDVQEFPGINKNTKQQRIVTRELSLNQFKNIPVGPIVLDFGQIFVSSAQKKTFHICNLNSKSISIQMQTKGNPEFEKISKEIQVIPAQSHGGFKVVYEALREGAFKHSLQYILNGRHYFEMLAVGTAILPTVQPSKTDFKFIAGEDDHTFQKKQSFYLNNAYPYEVQYSFVGEKDSLFKFTPAKGTIQPNGKQIITLTHNFLGIPEGGGKVEQTLKLKIKNGKKLQFKCVSIVPDCYIMCKPNQCNFKDISIYKQHQMKFSIRNSSKNFTVFKIVPNKDIQHMVTVVSSKTNLASDQSAQVTVKLMSQTQQLIDAFITVIVRGGRRINIPIRASLIAPKVKVESEQINFGSMPIGGNPTPKQISIINQSSISAQVQLVLPYQSFLSRCLSLKCESNQQRTISVKDSKERKAKIYLIKLSKKCKAQLTCEFQPQQVKDYKFTVPFYLASSNQTNANLQKTGLCRSLRNKLVIDHKELDFGKTIIQQNLENIPKSIVFTLINPLSQSIEWWTNQKNLQPFSLQIKKGKLQGNSEIKIKVFFYSEVPGLFEKQLSFFVNNSDFEPSKPYLKVPIRATANYPQIYFDTPYVIMPTVRLNEQSEARFQIINGGYENLNLKHVISQQFSEIDLTVKYLNGCHLGITKKSIPILLKYKSDKPISFTLKVDFYDHHNRVFSIYVSATVDNSLYTLPQSYWQPNPTEQLQKSASFLTNFLNAVGFVDDNLYDFPECLVENQFQNFQKLLQYYSPQLEKLQKMRFNPKKTNTLQQYYEYISEIVKILKTEGAFLNNIRIQHLFKEEEFAQILKNKSENIRIFSNYKLPESENFRELRTKSWIILILQILRVYSRVVLPAKKKNTSDFWLQMNQKERIIINWIEQCYQNEAGIEQIKTSSDLSTLSDGQMLSALITKYTNIKILDIYGKPPFIFKEKQKRSKKIIQTFGQIGLAPGLRSEDILRSKPVQMLVVLQRLYNILPHYLQKGEPVVFSCAVGQSLTKIIQIKNPSKFPVNYSAKIQGSKAYVIQNETQFTIQPKQKKDVMVKYISNIDVDKINGTLTLTGKTSSKFTPSTFIFVLKSVNLGRISEKNVQVTGQLYQPYQFQLNIKNNFAVDTNFNVQITPTSTKAYSKSLYCTTPTIKIKKDETVPVIFVFFPFIMQTHKFQIVFKDPKVGEFQYDLVGLVDMPQILPDPIRLNQTFYTNKQYTAEVIIPQRNQDIVRARKQIETYLQKIQRKSQSQALAAQRRASVQSVSFQSKIIYPILRSQSYSLSLLPQTDMVTLKTQSITLEPEQQENSSVIKKVLLQINMKMPARDAPIYLIMKNQSGNDIRRYKILINSAYKPLKYEVQIKVPIGQILTQPFPLINVSNQVNNFNVTFITNQSPNNKNAFTFNNQRQITVKGRQQSVVNLIFSPKIQQTYTGILKIQNATVGQIIQYEINGVGEEPLVQSVRLQQKTGQLVKHEIRMPFVKPQKCVVTKCTLNSNSIRYDKNFWYSSQSGCVFKFQFMSKIPGLYDGKVYIEDQSKIHAYDIAIMVTQSLAGTINIKTIQRVKKEVSISLQKGRWRVENFDPNIIIPAEIQISETVQYKFGYLSNKVGQYESQLIFKSETVGYLKYLLKITVEVQPQKIITNMKAQLGKTDTLIVMLQNPDSHPITVLGTCTNIEAFYYQPQGTFTIPAKSKKQVKFIYRPSCLQQQTGKIHLKSNSNIQWKYDLSGCGSLQDQVEVKEIDAEIGQQTATTISFINPFKRKLKIHIFLEEDKNRSQDIHNFKLVMKNNKHELDYLEEIQIPIKFFATEIRTFTSILKVLINENIYWRYAINARTIFKSQEETRTYKIPSRVKKQVQIPFILPHLPSPARNNAKFKCILSTPDTSLQNLLKTSCKVSKDWEKLKSVNEGKIEFSLQFLSYRPFHCPFVLEIYEQTGCKWVFKGQVQFTVPPIDDEFQIVSDINKATSVMFKLSNRVKSHTKYNAYFASQSDMQFNISPKTGDLQPYGRQGTQFQVTFAPTQYKNSWHGKIIIETQDGYWSYLVKGNLPHYIPPIGKSTLKNSVARKFTES